MKKSKKEAKELLINEIIFLQHHKFLIKEMNFNTSHAEKNFKRFKYYFNKLKLDFFEEANDLNEVIEVYGPSFTMLDDTDILNFYSEEVYHSIDSLVRKFVIDIRTSSEIGFQEGKTYIAQHFKKERNKRIIQMKKSNFLLNNGHLFCEACSFSFEDFYGDRGHNFIEVHHKVPVSELSSSGEFIYLDDLALLCSNCHSMIHASTPWLSIDELRKQIKKKVA